MVKQITVVCCDRCGKEIEGGHWTIKMDRLNINREFDICDKCEVDFKAFMMRKDNWFNQEETSEEEENKEVCETKTVVKNDIFAAEKTADDYDWRRSLPQKLLAYKRLNGLTYKDLGEMIGVGTGTVNNWCRGLNYQINNRTRDKFEEFARKVGL